MPRRSTSKTRGKVRPNVHRGRKRKSVVQTKSAASNEASDIDTISANATPTLRQMILDTKSGELSKSAAERRERSQQERLEKKKLKTSENDNMVERKEEENPKLDVLSSEQDNEEIIEDEEQTTLAPQVRVVNGMIVLDHSSLTFDREQPTAQNLETIDENESHITSHTYSKRVSSKRWNQKSTDKFYEALSKYGTDFTLIAHLFHDRTRRHIRNKFKQEEKLNIARIEQALTFTKPIDLADFDLNESILLKEKADKIVATQSTSVEDEALTAGCMEIVDEDANAE